MNTGFRRYWDYLWVWIWYEVVFPDWVRIVDLWAVPDHILVRFGIWRPWDRCLLARVLMDVCNWKVKNENHNSNRCKIYCVRRFESNLILLQGAKGHFLSRLCYMLTHCHQDFYDFLFWSRKHSTQKYNKAPPFTERVVAMLCLVK